MNKNMVVCGAVAASIGILLVIYFSILLGAVCIILGIILHTYGIVKAKDTNNHTCTKCGKMMDQYTSDCPHCSDKN